MQMMKSKKGDTIVETMFAFAIFGLVAIINLKIMQQGTNINQTALEINLAREQMTAQAEVLRLANSAFASELATRGAVAQSDDNLLWNKIIKQNSGSVSPLSSYVNNNDTCAKAPAKAFVLDPLEPVLNNALYTSDIRLKTAGVYPRLTYSLPDSNDVDSATGSFKTAEGLWIEAVEGKDINTKKTFYDFIIRTCWRSTASTHPLTLETLVRLYVPTM